MPTFVDGYGGDATTYKDAQIIDWQPTNFGAAEYMDVGQLAATGVGRTLIQFDLSSLNSGITVTSCTLELTLRSAGNELATNNRTLRIYRLTRAWDEATVTFGYYQDTNAWNAPGVWGGTDVENTSIGSCALATTDAQYAVKTFTLTPVSKAGLDLGYGWLIKADTEDSDMYQFYSSDVATTSYRPKLTIVYDVAPPDLSVSVNPDSSAYRVKGVRIYP